MTDTAPPLTDDSGLDEPVEAQPTGWSTVDWRRWMPLAAVIVGVLVAHLPYLLGIFDPNPLLRTSGLGTGIHPGPFPGLDTIDPNTGYISQALTHHAAESWLHGHVPWWNPFEGLGAPAAGEMSGMAMFLPVVLLAHFAQGEIAMYLLFGLVAAVSTYFLLLRLGLRPWICSAAGIAFGLDGTLAWFRISPANPVCFLPLMLLGLELIRDGVIRGRPTRWWLVALGLAMSVYAGFPEVTYLDGLVVAVWALARLQGITRGQIRAYALPRVGGAALVGVLLAAPLLVAFVRLPVPCLHRRPQRRVCQRPPAPPLLVGTVLSVHLRADIRIHRRQPRRPSPHPVLGHERRLCHRATVVLALAGLWDAPTGLFGSGSPS